MTHTVKVCALRVDWDGIKAQLEIYQQANKKIVLALGAVPNERDHFKLDEETTGFIYFNKEISASNGQVEPKDVANMLIQGNFNNIDDLTEIADNIAYTFDLIIPDYSVCGFMHLNKEHLSNLLKLLKNNGLMLCEYNDRARKLEDTDKTQFYKYLDDLEKLKSIADCQIHFQQNQPFPYWQLGTGIGRSPITENERNKPTNYFEFTKAPIILCLQDLQKKLTSLTIHLNELSQALSRIKEYLNTSNT